MFVLTLLQGDLHPDLFRPGPGLEFKHAGANTLSNFDTVGIAAPIIRQFRSQKQPRNTYRWKAHSGASRWNHTGTDTVTAPGKFDPLAALIGAGIMKIVVPLSKSHRQEKLQYYVRLGRREEYAALRWNLPHSMPVE